MALRRRVDAFLRLLAANHVAHRIIADLEEKAAGDYVFDEAYLRQSVQDLEAALSSMLSCLSELRKGGCSEIGEANRRVFAAIHHELDWQPPTATGELVLPFSAIHTADRYAVGSKSLRLAEMRHQVGLPVPPGFTITASAYLHFLDAHHLGQLISSRLHRLDPACPGDLVPVSRELQAVIRSCEVPGDLREAIEGAYRRLFLESTREPRVAVRSSALREDGVASFAGQYATALNVPGDRLVDEYREILASKFSPRAIFYFLNKGFRQEDLAMAVICQVMVPAVASGVVYSADPVNPSADWIVVNATWGLGQLLVDGRAEPDVYYVSRRSLCLADLKVSRKPVQLNLKANGGTEEIPVPVERQCAPVLTPHQLSILAEYALRLEEHYRRPQDIEFAVDPAGKVQILQSRTLRVERCRSLLYREPPDVTGHRVLLRGGVVASGGAGAGPVYLLRTDEDVAGFPLGGVLVAAQASPQLVVALEKAAAVVCDAGGVACHLAALAREFRVPALLSTGSATSVLPPGGVVTVCTDRLCVFEGRVEQLLERAPRAEEKDDLDETELFQLFHRLLPEIAPLHLVDPNKPSFKPACCESVHDVARFVHQSALGEVVRLAEGLADSGWQAPRLESSIPLSIQVLDVGAEGGPGSPSSRLAMDQVTCRPLKFFLSGLVEGPWPGPREVSLGGFMAVMAIHASGQHRLDEPCLAVVTDDYMSFSLRTGYHYSTVEAFCPEGGVEGYVRFHFRGGGAAVQCRARRERLIHEVLTWYGFSVDHRPDMIDAIAENLDEEGVESKLKLLAHLTAYTKQLDVILTDDSVTDRHVEEFKGEYHP